VAVEGQHLPSQRASIINRDFEPPIDEGEHFPAFRFWGRLKELISGMINIVNGELSVNGRLTMAGNVLNNDLEAISTNDQLQPNMHKL
jgi:hypothetical protein